MDYPEGAYEAFADRVGEPGAFGDPVKTNVGFETAKRAKGRTEAERESGQYTIRGRQDCLRGN